MSDLDLNTVAQIGVPEIDAQHAQLTEAIKTLHRAYFSAESEPKSVSDIVEVINEYVRRHFSTEEKYFRALPEYPELDAHLEQHAQFCNTILALLLDHVYGVRDITPELLGYLSQWWVNHINGMDQRMGALLRNRTTA